ncbi:hypothetical protein [Cryobacterium fucosi]|uniref:hypothetical protein n=1 Tax=Cryobacterium fucosi TaxID=1259157 RepID=UPI00141BAAA1|nr:hypothetical protein [Cryobacterium fucosi]
MNSGKIQDDLLDKIAGLIANRDSTLKQIEVWIESEPGLLEVLDDIRLHLTAG